MTSFFFNAENASRFKGIARNYGRTLLKFLGSHAEQMMEQH